MPGRDNGFVARHYLPLADLDPRLAEAMLDVLRAESIAAYVEPSTGRLGGYLEVHLPERPRDRLWVDRERRDRAATLLSEHTATPALPARPDASERIGTGADNADADDTATRGLNRSTIDDAWAQLIANYDLSPDDDVPPWPASEDVLTTPPADAGHIEGQQAFPFDALSATDPEGRDDRGAQPGSPVPRRIVRPADHGAASPAATPATPAPAEPPATERAPISDEYDPLSILDEHFVPPTPPPPPALRPATRWAILAIVAGFALIIVKAFTDRVPGGVALGVLGIVGGFVALVAGMRPDRQDDSDSDDGAVV